jgi:hypothetical protein
VKLLAKTIQEKEVRIAAQALDRDTGAAVLPRVAQAV